MYPNIKLNIGAGNTTIPDFIPIDIKFGQRAEKLNFETNSVSQIRASHILEHFRDLHDPCGKPDEPRVLLVLLEWVRVLRPGGIIKIAVPDRDWCFREAQDPNSPHNWQGVLLGGQINSYDIHKTTFSRAKLAQVMRQAGLISIQPWTSQYNDAASLPCSLNLKGFKQNAT